MNLFQLGDFTLRSGAKSRWKIECDALTPADWEGLAAMAVEILPPFSGVSGVPRGGIPFADALSRYIISASPHPVLIAEDVCTTGGSMERWKKTLEEELVPKRYQVRYIGVAVFARNPTWPKWVTPLFCFNPNPVIASAAALIPAPIPNSTLR